jgi:hypothetical protein
MTRMSHSTLEAPKMLWAESKDVYVDKTRYKDTVPADKKKNGFMSSDFPRRDEFSNTIRTAQLREILKVRDVIAGGRAMYRACMYTRNAM